MIKLGNEGRQEKEGSIVLGTIGTVVAGFIGMMLWYGLIKMTHWEIGYAAWGVGVLTGIGARLFMPQGNTALAVVSATCAFIAIIGGQYLVLNDEVSKMIDGVLQNAYAEHMAYAQKAVKAETDEQVKTLIAEEEAEEGKKPNAAAITDAQVKEFREKELPKLREFAGGKPPKAEYEATIRSAVLGGMSRWDIMKESVSFFTALWLFLGVGSAWKIAANEGSDD